MLSFFSSSIRDNIKFGKVDASEEDIVDAAKNAAVHKNIKGFSKGYDTILGRARYNLVWWSKTKGFYSKSYH